MDSGQKDAKFAEYEAESRTVTDIELYAIAKVLSIPWDELSPEKLFAAVHYCIFPLGCRRNSMLYFLLVFPNIDQACEDRKQNPETDSGPGDGIRMKKTEEAEVK